MLKINYSKVTNIKDFFKKEAKPLHFIAGMGKLPPATTFCAARESLKQITLLSLHFIQCHGDL